MNEAPPPIEYVSTALPARAAAALRGYGRPSGDTSVWPLSDMDLRWFTLASTHRRRIRRGVALFRGIAILALLCAAVLLLVMMLPLDQIPGLRMIDLVVGLLISIVTAIGCGLGAWGMHRNQIWGTMLVAAVLIVTLLAQIADSIPSITAGSESALIAITGDVIAALFTLGFLWTTWQTDRAIRQLRISPAWCQEALVAGGW